jgi:hypothetical protein
MAPGEGSIGEQEDEELGYLSPGEEGGSQFLPSPDSPGIPPYSRGITKVTSNLPGLRPSLSLPNLLCPIFRRNVKTVYIIRHGE